MKRVTLLRILRLLMVGYAVAILVLSALFYDRGFDPTYLELPPQLAQTLLYGGTALLLAVYAWFWPVTGGIAVIGYGLYQIFGHPLNLFAGHDPFPRNLFTEIPEPVYYTLNGLFTVTGLFCIISGWKYRNPAKEETELSERLRGITLKISLGAVIAAIIFGGVIVVTAFTRSYAPDYLMGSLFLMVVPILLLALITRYWAAPGGLLEIMNGVVWLVLGAVNNWEPEIFVPYCVLCALLITGGAVNIFRGYLLRIPPETAV